MRVIWGPLMVKLKYYRTKILTSGVRKVHLTQDWIGLWSTAESVEL